MFVYRNAHNQAAIKIQLIQHAKSVIGIVKSVLLAEKINVRVVLLDISL